MGYATYWKTIQRPLELRWWIAWKWFWFLFLFTGQKNVIANINQINSDSTPMDNLKMKIYLPVATHFNDTVGPGCSVCSENQ